MYLFIYLRHREVRWTADESEKKVCDKNVAVWMNIWWESILSFLLLLSQPNCDLCFIDFLSFLCCFEFCNNFGMCLCMRYAHNAHLFSLNFTHLAHFWTISARFFSLWTNHTMKKRMKKKLCLPKESTIGNCDKDLRKQFIRVFFCFFSPVVRWGFFVCMSSGAKS